MKPHDQGGLDSKDRPGHFTIDRPVTFKRRGIETKLILAHLQTTEPEPIPALIETIAEAHRWLEDLKSDRVESIGDPARRLGDPPGGCQP